MGYDTLGYIMKDIGTINPQFPAKNYRKFFEIYFGGNIQTSLKNLCFILFLD